MAEPSGSFTSTTDMVSPSGSSTGSVHVTPGRPKRSAVWDYFEYDASTNESVCQILSHPRELSPTSSDSMICGCSIAGKFPTNLRNHLKKYHPAHFAEVLAKEENGKSLKVSQQLTLAESLKSKTLYKKDSDKYRGISRKLAIFIASSNVSNSVVENLEFRDLLHTMDSRYQMPSRSAISKEIDKVLIELKAKIGSYLEEANKVSICADIWSKRGMSSSYLGITCHFYSRRDHRRHCVTLAVRRMPSPHTGEKIREVVDEVLEEWNISPSRVLATLTDNGSNMLVAFRPKLTDSSDDDDSELEDETEPDIVSDLEDFEENEIDHEVAFVALKRVSCFAHTLQLVVQKFDEVSTFNALLKRTHSIVRKFNTSTKATEKLISICGKKLVRDCPTRWSSTYLMLDRLLSVKSALCRVLQELEWDDLAVSEWKTLETLRSLLHPFTQSTCLVSGDEYTTISAVLPAIMDLNLHLEEVCRFRL